MDKTCKSSGTNRVAIFEMFSGARVRNTWVICQKVWDNSLKGELIPHVIFLRHLKEFKHGSQDLWFRDEPAAYQLVGGVKAHQG